MSTNIEYGSLAKFIVSLGVGFAILPILLIGFVMQENEIVLIEETDLLLLTETGKMAVLTKQEWQVWFMNNALSMVITLFIISFLLIVVGCVMWYPSQKRVDKKQEYELEIDKLKIVGLSPEEKEFKIQQEILELEQVQEDVEIMENEKLSDEQIRELQNLVKDNNRKINRSISCRYKEVEKIIAQRITEKLIIQYDTNINVKIDSIEYDVIAVAKEKYKDICNDYIFEIKYLFNENSMNIVGWKNVVYKLQRQVENYRKKIKKDAQSILIVVTLEDQVESIEMRVKSLIEDTDITLYVVAENRIIGL